MNDTILNIAGGKFSPIDLDKLMSYFLVNVDTMYYNNLEPRIAENRWRDWTELASEVCTINSDVFEFMERTLINFDRVCIYRFLEHVSMDKVLYFIYLLSTVTRTGAEIDVIVPNYKTLAQMILDEDPLDPAGGNFETHNIKLTTELLNEPSCPHASIWTSARAEYFFGLEGRFRIKDVDQNFEFDGRDIYLRFIAERI